MADYDQLMGQVIDAWLKRSKHVTAATIAVGMHAQRVLRHQLRRVDDPGERRAVRADAIERMVGRLQEVGAHISGAALCRAVQVAMVAKCFDDPQAKALPVNTLKAFCSVIVRDKKNETWSIREKVIDQARELWTRVVAGEVQPAAVADQVREVLGKKAPRPRQPKVRQSPVETIKALLPQLSEDSRRALYLVLSREFAAPPAEPPQRADVQVSVPMGDPPGKVDEPDTLRARILGRRRAG